MVHLIVDIHVRPESIDSFIALAAGHAGASRRETGCARFEVLRDIADSCHFALVETWYSYACLSAHRTTPHYARWRAEVIAMESGPRTRTEWTGLGHTAA